MRVIGLAGFAALAVLAVGPAMAQPAFDLGDGASTLAVKADAKARTVTVTLLNDSDLQQSITIGNAGVKMNEVVVRKLCATCTPAYFIPAYDLTSNYGAITGIVAWTGGGWWNLSILPLSIAKVAGPDAHGVYWLDDTSSMNGKVVSSRYSFEDGFLKAR